MLRPHPALVQREGAGDAVATDQEVQIQAVTPIQRRGEGLGLRRGGEVDPRGGCALQGSADLEDTELVGDAVVDPRAVVDGRPRVGGLYAGARDRKLLRLRRRREHGGDA
eukprot:10437745-Alexandrium_andersonii.AAC.1